MKRLGLFSLVILLAGIVTYDYVQAQQPPQQQDPPVIYGRGRGGVPFAWNDANRDGICDLTGQPIGQRPIGFGGGRGRWAMMGPVSGQVPAPVSGQAVAPYGRGRGGLPIAWNDANRDGICDLTGQPIGQRPIGYGIGMGRGGGGGRGGRWWR
jgi:hypothetical protein